MLTELTVRDVPPLPPVLLSHWPDSCSHFLLLNPRPFLALQLHITSVWQPLLSGFLMLPERETRESSDAADICIVLDQCNLVFNHSKTF